jgi:uncharacterized protein
MSNRVVHFEIHTTDPEKASTFYQNVFGWKIEEWKMQDIEVAEENRYWIIVTGKEGEPGINGGMVFRKGATPTNSQAVNTYVCTIQVDSVDEYVQKVQTAGGVVTVPKMPIPTIGWLAYCKDLDGNIFGLMQEDKNA